MLLAAVAERATPTRDALAAARAEHERLRAEMISAQEELDWEVYRRYGLLTDAEAAQVCGRVPRMAVQRNRSRGAGDAAPPRTVQLNRSRSASGRSRSCWPGGWPPGRRRPSGSPGTAPPHSPQRPRTGRLPTGAPWRRCATCAGPGEARIALIGRRRDLALIERPECKRRWAADGWGAQQQRALRGWLLDRCEDRALWFAVDEGGEQQPAPQTVRSLADRLLGDSTSRTPSARPHAAGVNPGAARAAVGPR